MPKGTSAGRPKRPARDLIRFMEANGFAYDHCNTKSVQYFTHPTRVSGGSISHDRGDAVAHVECPTTNPENRSHA